MGRSRLDESSSWVGLLFMEACGDEIASNEDTSPSVKSVLSRDRLENVETTCSGNYVTLEHKTNRRPLHTWIGMEPSV
jgi:hypothetical protein